MKQAKRPQKTRPFAFVLAIILSLTIAVAQLLFKQASSTAELTFAGVFTNIPLLAGFLIYGLSAVFFVIALRYGKLSVLYPVLGLGFIWVAIGAQLLFQEELHLVNWLGIGSILLGVSLIGRGEQHA